MPRRGRGSLFDSVKGIIPGKSPFDLSYEKKFTCDMGYLIPVLCDEAVPGDIWEIGMECVVRTLPLAAPILHPVYITYHVFFVPFRVLGDHEDVAFDWETFITGGKLGNDASTLPSWNPTDTAVKSLWDYMGFPIGVDAAGARPNAWPLYGYNLIWNEYFRDEDIDDEVDIATSESVLKARWERDYFTACRPYQQRGTAPSISLTLSGSIPGTLDADPAVAGTGTNYIIGIDTGADKLNAGNGANNADLVAALEKMVPTIDISSGSVTGIDMTSLRLSAAIQQFMELSMRSGYRYTEFLQAIFNVGGDLDTRLDRPEYIGGTKQWLIVSEVLQTSESGVTPQGTLVGHGMAVGSQRIGSYHVKEHGVIIGLFCIRPKTCYHQGIDRQWLRETRYDYYNPLFANMSEQEVLERELYCSGTEAHHLTVFGYIPPFDEMRVKKSMVCGDMHTDYDHWHLARNFSGRPTLNSSFIECTPRKDVFAATAEDGFMVSWGNRIRCIRPMPLIGTPGIGRL